MSSDTSATGEIPALEPETGPTALAARQASGLAARQASGLAALAPGRARGVVARGLARSGPAEHRPAAVSPWWPHSGSASPS